MVDIGNPVPREITRSGVQDIQVLWNDGHESIYPSRYLRLKCPCAECVDEWTGLRVLKGEDVNREVAPNSLQLVGRYGVRIYWGDGHSAGIYTFRMLRRLCPCQECQAASEADADNSERTTDN